MSQLNVSFLSPLAETSFIFSKLASVPTCCVFFKSRSYFHHHLFYVPHCSLLSGFSPFTPSSNSLWFPWLFSLLLDFLDRSLYSCTPSSSHFLPSLISTTCFFSWFLFPLFIHSFPLLCLTPFIHLLSLLCHSSVLRCVTPRI